MSDLTKEISQTTNKLNCSWEKGELEAGKLLSSQLENLNNTKDILRQNVDILGSQIIKGKNKSLKDFFETDVKAKLQQKRDEWNKKSAEAKDVAAVNAFVKEVEQELKNICGNNSDIVMALQIYVNGLNDINDKHAVINYTAKTPNYKAGEERRLFIDGFLGTHTYNALWLAMFKEELPKVTITRDDSYYFDRNEPRIISKDLPYVPLTLPKVDASGEVVNETKLEIIEKLKQPIELIYLFYDGLKSAGKLSMDIDEEIIKIMENPENYNENTKKYNYDKEKKPLDIYLYALKELNSKLSGNNEKFKKGANTITSFLNNGIKYENAEVAILSTLEYDIGVHEYVADCIAKKYKSLTIDQVNTLINADYKNDKAYNKYKEKNNKQRQEQKKLYEGEIKTMFLNMKNALIAKTSTQQDIDAFVQIFGVLPNASNVDTKINDKVTQTLQEQEKIFMDTMNTNYIQKRELEKKISGSPKDVDGFGHYIGQDKELALFADVQGIGDFDMSSENWEGVKFYGKMIAEEALCFAVGAATAGVGGLALKAALYGRRAVKIGKIARYGAKTVKSGKDISRFEKMRYAFKYADDAEKVVRRARSVTLGGKVINAGTTLMGVTVGGTLFYESVNSMQNILKGVPMFQGWNDYPEIAKSIAMFGALKIINHLVATPKIVTLSGKKYNANPLNKLLQIKNGDKRYTKGMKIGGESLVGGAAIFAVEGLGEMAIDTNHDWTKEELIQAILMYALFRGAGEAGKLFLRKNPKTGKPEIVKENPNQRIKELNDEILKINKEIKGKVLPKDHPLIIHRNKLMVERDGLLPSQAKPVVEQNKALTPEQSQKIKDLNAEILKINKEIKGKVLPKDDPLIIHRNKLMVERDGLLPSQVKPVVEQNKALTPEQSQKIKDLNSEILKINKEIKGKVLPKDDPLIIHRNKLMVERDNIVNSTKKPIVEQVKELSPEELKIQQNEAKINDYKAELARNEKVTPGETPIKEEIAKLEAENSKLRQQIDKKTPVVEQKVKELSPEQIKQQEALLLNNKKLIIEQKLKAGDVFTIKTNNSTYTFEVTKGGKHKLIETSNEKFKDLLNTEGGVVLFEGQGSRGIFVNGKGGKTDIYTTGIKEVSIVNKPSLLNRIKNNPIKTAFIAIGSGAVVYTLVSKKDEQGNEYQDIEVKNGQGVDPKDVTYVEQKQDSNEFVPVPEV